MTEIAVYFDSSFISWMKKKLKEMAAWKGLIIPMVTS